MRLTDNPVDELRGHLRVIWQKYFSKALPEINIDALSRDVVQATPTPADALCALIDHKTAHRTGTEDAHARFEEIALRRRIEHFF